MEAASLAFKENARRAIADPVLQQALSLAKGGFQEKRRAAAAKLPEFEALRDQAKAIKDHTLAHLDLYLEAFEQRVIGQGGKVHWARDAAEARAVVLRLCKNAGARSVTKSKSMIAEEIGLNEALEAAGIRRVETDLGEYIVQLAGQTPSHILAPAIHMTKGQVSQLFAKHHHAPQGHGRANVSYHGDGRGDFGPATCPPSVQELPRRVPPHPRSARRSGSHRRADEGQEVLSWQRL